MARAAVKKNAAPARRDGLQAELRSLRREVKRLRQELARHGAALDLLLRRRGFRVYKQEHDRDLLLPAKKHHDEFYRLLQKYSFRLFLRDVIRHQDRFTADQLTRYATSRTVRSYIERLLGLKLAEACAEGYRLVHRPMLSFGPTLEWYVAELLQREFGAETLRSVKFRRPEVGGDYDVIARLGSALLYLEVKSSPPKQVHDSEVSAFLDRVDDLAPEAAVFLMDTELRMKDKLVPLFEKALEERGSDQRMVRLEREIFSAGGRLFIVNAKESIAGNIGTVVNRCLRTRRAAQ